MRLRYIGPHVSVQIAATGQTVERGGTVEVETALARSLLEQAHWKKVTRKRKTKE